MKRPDLVGLFLLETPRLLRRLRRFGGRVSAEDVAQEAFARLAGTDLSAIERPRAYLFQTARNLALNEAQRGEKNPVRAVPNLGDIGAADDRPDPEQAAIAAENAARVQAALQSLPERQRQALVLFKVDGLTHKEIGRRLGVSHRTVERYVADAIAHCHAILSADR